jgi:ABC-type lipoprotein release transport system permease subunit
VTVPDLRRVGIDRVAGQPKDPVSLTVGVARVFDLTAPRQRKFDVAPRDPTVLGTVCAVLLATGVLASLVPAIRATRVDPAVVLRSE